MSREGIRVREISPEEGDRLLRIVRRSSGSVVTWRPAQMVLLSAKSMDVAQIARWRSPRLTGSAAPRVGKGEEPSAPRRRRRRPPRQ